jgi:DNA-binding NtrC family response regulator
MWNSDYPPTSRHILIVDDEVVVRNFARSVLQNCGHVVMTAASVDEARSIVAAQDCTNLCLVVDVMLQDDSGIALTQELVEIQPSFRVLLMSGFTDDVLIGGPEHQERFGFLRKPFTREELVTAVESVCRP